MPKDKYSAVWVSHSSISDFLNCPKAYYLKNVYKSPKTGHKIKLVTPALTLGSVVHNAIESLSVLPTAVRFKEPLIRKFQSDWAKFSGKSGGFYSEEAEKQYKSRGESMIRRIMENPGPLKNPAVKISMDLPYYWLSEEDNIILCGKIDWLEYLPDSDGVHIIDFKTSKGEENEESLQLPIYNLLARNCQKRPVERSSYWYIDRNNLPRVKEITDLDETESEILKIAKKIKLARQIQSFDCPEGAECKYCKQMQMIIDGKADYIGVDEYNYDAYSIPPRTDGEETEDRDGAIL